MLDWKSQHLITSVNDQWWAGQSPDVVAVVDHAIDDNGIVVNVNGIVVNGVVINSNSAAVALFCDSVDRAFSF